MTIHREYWKPQFSNFPSWVCPRCQSGTLILNKDTLTSSETGLSKKARDDEAWEPRWIEERFSGQLICQNAACGEIVAIGGSICHVEYCFGEEEPDWVAKYEPKFIFPAPHIFTLPETCPPAITEELKKAFSLYWFDLESSAGRLRAATEELLTERKVPRHRVNKKGKKKMRLPLHDRIAEFKKTDPSSAEFLLAIKWQGNTGSHASDTPLAQDDLLNGFELFEDVVERIYVKKEKRLNKIAKEINSRRGRPIRKRLPKMDIF